MVFLECKDCRNRHKLDVGWHHGGIMSGSQRVGRGMTRTEHLMQAMQGKGGPALILEEPLSQEIHRNKEDNRRQREFLNIQLAPGDRAVAE